eukprot:CAMPEP_0168316756 /NCGR_PEP_ID=MMETSP0210-20121227/18935_1 /TAXON_ID=40633 /ORGANISM="Condylostoma magnum, Strain COL2" /LENGTH=83 /DNA_ID=CAMNT_0008303983 /DNA_START=509 /DNA_END=759 /DNA_ORIENTATION=-
MTSDDDDESDWDSDDDESDDDDEVFENRGDDPETRRRFWEIKDKGKTEGKKKTKVKAVRPKKERDFSKGLDQDKDYSSMSVIP